MVEPMIGIDSASIARMPTVHVKTAGNGIASNSPKRMT